MRDFAYQAQLVEQECGSDYFGLLQALDTDRWNGCHDTVAALAGAGFVRAVVTTNFDTLTEQALAAERVEHRVHFTPDSWPGRAARFDGGHAPAAGARPHRGPRRRAEAPVRAPPLAGSRIVSGSFSDWLDDLARNLGVDRPFWQAAPGEEVDRLRAERLAQVAGRAAAWAAELGDMAAINVMAALLRGSGNDEGSFACSSRSGSTTGAPRRGHDPARRLGREPRPGGRLRAGGGPAAASDDLVEQVPGLLPRQYLAREADDLEPRLSGA